MQVGYVGKLPAYGDFVQGGGSLHACKAWSDWAERGLAATRDIPGFHDTFLTSPIWRFAVADGVVGNAPVAGVFCPSMDKVGRLFPFALLCELQNGVSPIAACMALGPWFDRLEGAALAALEPSATVESMTAAITDPAMIRGGLAAPLASTPRLEALDVTSQGDPIPGSGDPLDLSDDDDSTGGDGAWITLGGLDADAHGIMQHGIATDALFARLVTGGDAHGV